MPQGETFLQTAFWGSLKSQFGWKALAFERDFETSEDRYPLLVLLRSLPSGAFLAYIPHGPQGALGDLHGHALQRALEDLADSLKPHLPLRTLFLRFDLPNFARGAQYFPEPLSSPFRRAHADIQPPDTVVLDVSLEANTLLGNMKKKTRYNIKLAQKGDVSYRKGSLEDLESWYKLYEETGARDKIALHSFEYYRKQFEMSLTSSQSGGVELHLLLAYHDNRLIAGNIVLTYGEQGVYLYGASSNHHRNLMAPYGLQWMGIELCKDRGCKTYDLFGIPPTSAEGHPMHGLYRFKTGFGGEILHRLGAWDLPFWPLSYRFYRLVEGLRTWYFKTFRKR